MEGISATLAICERETHHDEQSRNQAKVDLPKNSVDL